MLTETELATAYPRLYHMAEDGSWPSIVQHGLLSTSELLRLFDIAADERTRIESAHRPVSVSISHKDVGEAVIRDQKPMSDKALRKCLSNGLTPSDWYRLLNQRVFFWLSRERLSRLLAARAYRSRRHTVIELDTALLIAAYRDQITLSPINSGSTVYNPQPRGVATFSRIKDYPYDEWRRKRGSRNAIAELAIDGGVYDVRPYVIRVTAEGGGAPLTTIYP